MFYYGLNRLNFYWPGVRVSLYNFKNHELCSPVASELPYKVDATGFSSADSS